MLAVLRGEGGTLTLGLVVPAVKRPGILSWGHSYGKVLGFLISPNLLRLLVLPAATSCHFQPALPRRLPFCRPVPIPAGSMSSHATCSHILTQGEWPRAWAAS